MLPLTVWGSEDMKNFSLLIILFVCFASFSAELFEFPPETKVINRDKSGKTWQINAVINLPFDKTKKLLHNAIIKKQYKLKHEIPMDEKGKQHLIISYTKGKENLVLMIWSPDGKKTFFAYGVMKK